MVAENDLATGALGCGTVRDNGSVATTANDDELAHCACRPVPDVPVPLDLQVWQYLVKSEFMGGAGLEHALLGAFHAGQSWC